MHKTRRGRIVVGAGLGLFVLAYAFATVAPAILGLIVLAWAAFARARFQALLAEVHFEAERTPPSETPHQDEPVRLVSRMVVGPPGLRVTIHEPGTADIEVQETRAKPVKLTPSGVLFDITTRVVPKRRGSHRLRTVRVDLQDPTGLFRHAYEVEAPLEFTAHAPRAAFRRGRALRQLQAVVQPRRTDPGDWSDEVLAHRDYLPGDRVRAIDWKATARFDKLLTRTFLKEVERPLVLMLDASRTMRYRGPRISMLDHGAEVLSVFLGSASKQGVNTGFVAFDEYRILQMVRPTKDLKLPRLASLAIAALPDPIEIPQSGLARRRRNGDDHAPSGSGAEPSAFERAVAPFLGGRYAKRIPHGMSRAMHAMAPPETPSTVVVFSDLVHASDRAVAALLRARRHQHNVVVVAPFWPWYHLRPDEVDTETLEAVYDAWDRRARRMRKLETAGIAILDTAPGVSGRDLVIAHGRVAR